MGCTTNPLRSATAIAGSSRETKGLRGRKRPVSADNLQTTPKARPPTRGEVVVEDANPPKVKREEDAEEKQPIAEVRVEEKSPERKEKKAHPRVAENREREPVVQEKLEGEKEVEVEGGRWQRTEGLRYPGGIGLARGKTSRRSRRRKQKESLTTLRPKSPPEPPPPRADDYRRWHGTISSLSSSRSE